MNFEIGDVLVAADDSRRGLVVLDITLGTVMGQPFDTMRLGLVGAALSVDQQVFVKTNKLPDWTPKGVAELINELEVWK